jgi:alpha-ribazole phosphatase
VSGTLWAARHAPVTAEPICYGRTEVTTRISHEEAADRLATSFPGARPSVVWSSPTRRCAAVAEHLAARWGIEHRVDSALYELSFGVWDGLPWAVIEAEHRDAYARWLEEWQEMPPPGGECPRDLEARVTRWLATLDSREAHVLIAHAGVVRALRVVLERRAWPDSMALPVEHLAWSRFTWPTSSRSGK